MSGIEMMDLIAVAQPNGGYFSLVKIIVLALLLLPWFILAPWVQKDAKKVHASQTTWPLAVLVVGALTVLIWITQPFYFIGLLGYILLTGSVLIAYVAQHNARVHSEEEKILTIVHLKGLFSSKKEEKEKPIKLVTKLRLYNAGGKASPPPAPDAVLEDQETYNVAQELLYDIVFRRASEADLTPQGGQTRVRFLIDGVVQERPPLPQVTGERVIQYLKGVGGMDVSDHRRPQAGKMAVDLAGMQIEIVLRSAGTTNGQRMQFRVIQEFVQTQLDALGMDEATLGRIREVNNAGRGLIIVSGRAGSGVTSTLYSLLREQDAFIQQVESIEARPALEMENILQHAYGDAKDEVPSLLSAVLQRNPNVIMMDDCPDPTSAQMIARAAPDKMVLLGMAAGDTFMALAKWIKLCGDAGIAVGPLKLVLCQMLLRKLCPNCREPYVPNPDMLAKANISGQGIERFYRPPTKPPTDEDGNPMTCVACQGTGYLGRTAVFELMDITDELREMIRSGAPLPQIKATCRKNRMLYLQEQALQRVIGGITSIQEVIRLSQPDRKPEPQERPR
jgi:type II secretory ATPase GspE/PulE/Tfp pilus assembly ATPase PilB-like protein